MKAPSSTLVSRRAAITTAAMAVVVVAPLLATPVAQAADPAPRDLAAPACLTAVPAIRADFASKIGPGTSQVVVVRGNGKHSWHNSVEYWARTSGCWSLARRVDGRNGVTGWSWKPRDGSGLSPIGVYTLTDAAGRLPNPGTKLPYHYGPQSYDRGGYRMNNQRRQVFDYLVAINFNRYPGATPHDLRRPNPKIHDGGIWFHVRGTGPTRGCVSVKRSQMAWTLRWLSPKAKPTIVMGPKRVLAG